MSYKSPKESEGCTIAQAIVYEQSDTDPSINKGKPLYNKSTTQICSNCKNIWHAFYWDGWDCIEDNLLDLEDIKYCPECGSKITNKIYTEEKPDELK